jgi:hypothetical protein
LQRAAAGSGNAGGVPPIVHDVLRGPGQPLDNAARAYFEPRLGDDFSRVRVHTGEKAAASARAVNALAYTVGRDLVFGAGQYSPSSAEGRRLLVHELTHVVQQGATASVEPTVIGHPSDRLEHEAEDVSRTVEAAAPRAPAVSVHASAAVQRTPAKKVDCASTAPLRLPGGGQIDDPVGVITAAERRANELLDAAIGELDSTRQRVLAGSPAGWPTVSDNLGFALQLLRIDPNRDSAWKASGGSGTVALLLYRLRWIRRQIGSGDFFFTCLGPVADEAGRFICGSRVETPTEVVIKEPAIARVEGFHIYLCESFWKGDNAGPENQAATLIHETAHTFADFIQDERTRGPHVAQCYARFALLVGGSRVEGEDLGCPDPEASGASGGK